MHRLLTRQLRRFFGPAPNILPPWRTFLEAVDEAYTQSDADRAMLERSLDLSSQELVDANTEMRAVCQAIPDLVLRLEREGTILDIKCAAIGELPSESRQFQGRRIEETPLRPFAQQFLRAIRRVIDEQVPVNFEYAAGPQGNETHHEVRLVPLAGAQALAIIRDISDRKRAEIENAALLEEIKQLNAALEQKVVDRTEALRRQEALFQAAAEQAPQVVWIANARGAVTYLNRSWYELVGGAPPKWHGHEWTQVVLAEDVAEMRRKWEDVKLSGSLFAGTRRVRAVDGSLHMLSYRASPVRDASGQISCWIGMDADITEIKAIEGALRLSNRELEAFSYSVSHDLRAPLGAIDGFSRALAEHLDSKDGEKLQHYLSRIQSNVSHMRQLIDSLLALAQVSRGRLDLVPVNLSEIATSVVDDLRSREAERDVSVTVEPGLVVTGDAGLLAVAVENLLGNAWKFTSRKDGARIAVGRRVNGDGESTFYVTDNGAGFDMQYADKLFGTFQRLHSTAEFPGTGVGLATVRRVAARHGGRVWAESEVGKGATFYLDLPSSHPACPTDGASRSLRIDSRFGLL